MMGMPHLQWLFVKGGAVWMAGSGSLEETAAVLEELQLCCAHQTPISCCGGLTF